ncbi:LemA family protein [Hydrogenophilus thiooxidans]|uniref:LemA family protein n=1 Tax=Hydrogenophilus thiooxidans TaxID=2820326 RepID=UPI001C21FB06|nr:LemA family protein [Hydrogenophilus thiooxidans]
MEHLTTWLLILTPLAFFVWGIVLYNRLVTLRQRAQNGWAQIDVQLQRRHDLIPNLVETVKAYLTHERETLEAVIRARQNAVAAQTAAHAATQRPRSSGIPDRDTMAHLAEAESALGGMLSRLFALAEAYPDLKATANVQALFEALTTTENRIAFARQAYNDSVTAYNTHREQFPDLLIAQAFAFPELPLWEASDRSQLETPPPVRLS